MPGINPFARRLRKARGATYRCKRPASLGNAKKTTPFQTSNRYVTTVINAGRRHSAAALRPDLSATAFYCLLAQRDYFHFLYRDLLRRRVAHAYDAGLE